MDAETGKKRILSGIIHFNYHFKFEDGSEEIFYLKINNQDLTLLGNTPDILPDWTKLDYYQCSNCPLIKEDDPYCPLASNLVNIVKQFEPFLSYNKVSMSVATKERIISQKTTVQRGVSSILGLVFATSGCPHLAFFRPMARFHLPLANEEETAFRATSMYLLAQYFMKRIGKEFDHDLDGLSKIYDNIKVVNSSIAQRLRHASKTDSTLNAIVLLDVFANTIPFIIKSSLDEIRYLFTPYLLPEA